MLCMGNRALHESLKKYRSNCISGKSLKISKFQKCDFALIDFGIKAKLESAEKNLQLDFALIDFGIKAKPKKAYNLLHTNFALIDFGIKAKQLTLL